MVGQGSLFRKLIQTFEDAIAYLVWSLFVSPKWVTI